MLCWEDQKYKTISVSLTPVCGQVLHFIIIGNYITPPSLNFKIHTLSTISYI